MTILCDWISVTLPYTVRVCHMSFIYSFGAKSCPESDAISYLWRGRCVHHYQHVSLDSGEPSCRIRSYIFFVSLLYVFLLLPSWNPHFLAVSVLYVAIVRIFLYLEKLRLNDRMSRQMAALLAELCWTVIFLSFWTSGYCKYTDMAGYIYHNPSYILTHNDAALQLRCHYNIHLVHFSAVIAWYCEFLYHNRKTNGCKVFAHTLRPVVIQYEWRYSRWNDPIVQEYCCHFASNLSWLWGSLLSILRTCLII